MLITKAGPSKNQGIKTDPFRQGISIFLGTTNNELCPVAAMAAYPASRGNAPGPFFQFNNGEPLTREHLVKHLREALTNAGINVSKFSGHRASVLELPPQLQLWGLKIPSSRLMAGGKVQ